MQHEFIGGMFPYLVVWAYGATHTFYAPPSGAMMQVQQRLANTTASDCHPNYGHNKTGPDRCVDLYAERPGEVWHLDREDGWPVARLKNWLHSNARYWCVTYETVTPESAEDGDAAERGFVLGGGHEAPCDAVGEEWIAWCEENDVHSPLPEPDPLEDAEDTDARYLELRQLVTHYAGVRANGETVREDSDGRMDYTTGACTTRTLHLQGLTEEEMALVKRWCGGSLTKGGK